MTGARSATRTMKTTPIEPIQNAGFRTSTRRRREPLVRLTLWSISSTRAGTPAVTGAPYASPDRERKPRLHFRPVTEPAAPAAPGPSDMSAARPIGPYERRTAEVHEWDPRTEEVARRIGALVRERRPDLAVEHIGSTAVPGLPGKGIVDLSIETDPADIPGVVAMLYELGFQAQPGPDPWPPTRPMPVGSLDLDGARFRLHLHVQPIGGDFPRDIAFRDLLR